MKVIICLFALMGLISASSSAQYYSYSFPRDAVPMATALGAAGLSIYLYKKEEGPQFDEINFLDPADLNFLDRKVINNYSSFAQESSDILLFTSVSFPLLSLISKESKGNRKAIVLMAIETALLNNGISHSIKSITKRYRPFNYNSNVPIEIKLEPKSKRSFVSGHVSHTASYAFLSARILSDLYPEMRHKYLLWTTAATFPAIVGYLRIKAGRHFPTDVIGGYIVGTLVGYFLPSFHIGKTKNLSINTAFSQTELSFYF